MTGAARGARTRKVPPRKPRTGGPGNLQASSLMAEAARLSREGMRAGRGGPFGAVVAQGGKILAGGCNEVLATNDPTAHAEVVAIRAACRALGSFDLSGCELYTSCEPCPMCLAAAYWARIDRIVFANTRRDAAAIGFGDAFIYRELAKPAAGQPRPGKAGARKLPMLRLRNAEAAAAFAEWARKRDRIHYGPEI